MNYLFEKVRRSLGGHFLAPHICIATPFFVLRTPCFVALLRETCPATDAGVVWFLRGSSCPRWTRVSFSGSALPPLSGPCAFAESAQLIWLAHGFRLLAFLGDALLPLLGDFTRFSYGLVPVVAICPL